MVTTRNDAAARLDVEFHPVAGLIAKAATPESLIQRVRSQVAPDTWTGSGGQAMIDFDPPSATLLVRQTQPAQVQIELLLAQIGREAAAKKPAP